jgi:branched-chain amino acid transport system substrate-binding protein
MRKIFLVLIIFIFSAVSLSFAKTKPIVLGCPLSTGFLYGWDAERGIKLAVKEINDKGGVTVNGEKRLFKD